MKHPLGDAPIEPHLREVMSALAKAIDEILNGEETPKPNGFLLMVFPSEGFDGRCNYISTADRREVMALLKEQLAHFKGRAKVKGKA
jgi:hypothetical protein